MSMFLITEKAHFKKQIDFVLEDGNIDIFLGFLAVYSRRDNFQHSR